MPNEVLRLGVDDALTALRGAAEPTRLRILAALTGGELTVTELCRILSQTQPRVSRHLKLLIDARLLERHQQGNNAFYRLTSEPEGAAVIRSVINLVDLDDDIIQRDQRRLAEIRTERAAAAADYFEAMAAQWNDLRARHIDDAIVEKAMLELAAPRQLGELLDIGTGTGRVLELFADRITRGIGVDLSGQMLNLARSRLNQSGLTHCSVRQGDLYGLDVDDQSVDFAVLHHVLHFLDDPARALAEVARTLRPGGQLMVVDFAPHDLTSLAEDHMHRWLGFAPQQMNGWLRASGLDNTAVTELTPPDDQPDALTVTIWLAKTSNTTTMARNDT